MRWQTQDFEDSPGRDATTTSLAAEAVAVGAQWTEVDEILLPSWREARLPSEASANRLFHWLFRLLPVGTAQLPERVSRPTGKRRLSMMNGALRIRRTRLFDKRPPACGKK